MGKLRFFFILVACSVVATFAFAHSDIRAENEDIFYFGFPQNHSCGDWTEARKSTANYDVRSEILEAWLMGFVTGHNMFTSGDSQVGSGATTSALFAWVDNYCEANPLDHMLKASNELIRELKARRSAQ